MPNVSITIPYPVLQSGQSFNVRYRELPSGSWTDISPKTNAQFTISGISAGYYELEVRLSLGGSPVQLCPPVVQRFYVEEEYGCPEIDSAEITRSGQQSQIVITATPAGTPYPCGYEIEYFRVGATGRTTIKHATFPSSITIPIATPPADHHVMVWGVPCDGSAKILCWDDTLEAPTSCDPITVQSPGASYVKSGNQYYIRFPFNQSTPASPTLLAAWKQKGIMVSGTTDPGGQQSFNAVSPILVPITPNTNIQPEVSGILTGKRLLRYDGTFVDQCGVSRYYDLAIAIDEIPDIGGAQPVVTGYINIFVNNYTAGATLTYTIEVRERATSTNIAANGVGRTIASGAGNTINGGNATIKSYNQYDMRITLSSAPYSKVFSARWDNGMTQNVGSVTVAPTATSSWIELSNMAGSGGLYVDILDVV